MSLITTTSYLFVCDHCGAQVTQDTGAIPDGWMVIQGKGQDPDQHLCPVSWADYSSVAVVIDEGTGVVDAKGNAPERPGRPV